MNPAAFPALLRDSGGRRGHLSLSPSPRGAAAGAGPALGSHSHGSHTRTDARFGGIGILPRLWGKAPLQPLPKLA